MGEQPIQMQLPTIDVPLVEENDKDPYDDIQLPSVGDPRTKQIEEMYKAAQAYKVSNRNPTGSSSLGDKASTVADEVIDYMGAFAKDTVEAHKQVFVGGILDTAQSFLNTGLDVGEWTYEKLGLPYTKERFTFADKLVPRSESDVIRFQRSMVEFMPIFAGSKAVTSALKMGSITSGLINGAIADFIAADPREEKVQQLLKTNPELINPFMTAMHSNNSADMWKKVETMYQGALLGMGLQATSTLLAKGVSSLLNVTKNYYTARLAKSVHKKQVETAFLKSVASEGEEVVDVIVKESGDVPPPISKIDSSETDAAIELIKKGKAGDRAFNMTLAGITNEKEKQRVIKALVDKNKEMFEAQKGGIKSREVLEAEAKALNMTPDKLLRRSKGTPTYDAMNRAAVNVSVEVIDDLIKAGELYEKGLLGADDFLAANNVATATLMQLSDMATVSGRATQAFQVVGPSGLEASKRISKIKEIQRLYGPNLKGQAQALKELRKMEKRVIENALSNAKASGRYLPSLDDMIMARNNWILSSPKTHIKNIVSNTAQLVGTIVDTAFQEMMFGLTGSQSTARGETRELIKGMFDGFSDVLRIARHNIKNPKDMTPFFSDLGTYSKIGQSGINLEELTSVGLASHPLNYIISGKTVGKALGNVDDIFKQINYRAALRRDAHHIAVKYRGLKGKEYDKFMHEVLSSPPPEMHLNALDTARTNTFTQDRVGLGKAAEELIRNPWFKGIDRLVVPFIGTNLNVLEQTLLRTPLVGLLTTRARGAITNAANNPRALQQLVAKQATGAAFLGTIAYAMDTFGLFQPQLTGGYERKQMAKSFGISPNTIKIGNAHISMDALSPMTGAVTFLANMKELYDVASTEQSMQLDEAMQVMAYAFGELVNPTFMTETTGDLLEALTTGDPEKARYVFTSIGSSSVIPFSGLIRALIPKDGVPDTRVAGGFNAALEETYNQMRAIVAPNGLPKIRDMFGDPIPRNEGLVLGNLDPFTATRANTDPVVKEIVRLAEADRIAVIDQSEKLIIRKPQRTIIKKLQGMPEQVIDLNANQYEELSLFCAGTAPRLLEAFKAKKKAPPKSKHEAFTEMMSGDKYKKAPDWLRKAMIISLEEAYNKAGKEAYMLISGEADKYVETMRSIMKQRELELNAKR